MAIGFKLVLANACGILKVKDIFDDRLVVSDANVKNNKYIRKIGRQCWAVNLIKKNTPKDRVMYMHIYRDINLIFLIGLFIFLIYIKQQPTTRTIK